MAKVGLKETLALLAAGYKKKEIEALAEIDLEEIQPEQPAAQASEDKEAPVPEAVQAQPKDPEPDYKAMYEDLLKQNKEKEAKITKLQQANVHEDSAPAAAAEKAKEAESLNDLVRSFM
jgi:hypothetical protein